MNCQYSFICFFLFIWNPERFTFTLFWHYYTCENKFKKTNRKHQYSHTDECEAKRKKTKFKVISCFSSLLSKAPRQKRFRPEIEFNEKKISINKCKTWKPYADCLKPIVYLYSIVIVKSNNNNSKQQTANTIKMSICAARNCHCFLLLEMWICAFLFLCSRNECILIRTYYVNRVCMSWQEKQKKTHRANVNRRK